MKGEAHNGVANSPPLWCGSDKLDPPRDDYKVTPELYNLDGVAYESIVLGLFTIWRGQFPGREKPNEVCVGYSRDGWSWTRPDRRGFLPISETKGDWNYANVQSAGGGCLVMGDQLYFYCSGRGNGHVTSLAVLRRDGFTSVDAGDKTGTLTTRPLRFGGQYPFVNVDAAAGELRVEVLDDKGEVLAPYSAADCVPVRADKTLQRVVWKDAADLSKLSGKTVKLRFHLTNGKLYAFWVSAKQSGASHGYVGAGGPGFSLCSKMFIASPAMPLSSKRSRGQSRLSLVDRLTACPHHQGHQDRDHRRDRQDHGRHRDHQDHDRHHDH